jgi:hypothetical protein
MKSIQAKITALLFFVFVAIAAQAQFNVHELGKKAIYFGISIGGNVQDFTAIHKPFSAQNDSIRSYRAKIGPGFTLGIIGNYQFHRYFDLRFIPALTFSDKNLEYVLKSKNTVVKKTVSSIYLDFPVLIRYKSEPIKDFRIYVLAGMRYSFDLASNQKTRKADDLIKLGRHDVAVEYGVGFMVYFPYFILSPEFKMSHGILNIHKPTDGLIYSRVIDKLFSRAFTLTINLEG